MSERWLPIPGFEGKYEVSNLGRVRSLRQTPVLILRPGIASHGYPTVALHGVSYPVGWLVLMAFTGPRPAGYVCRHLDGDKLHNHETNLEWSTQRRNHQDKKWHLPLNGRNRKLTPTVVEAIKYEILFSNKTTDDIGRLFGVSGRTIRYIRALETHADV